MSTKYEVIERKEIPGLLNQETGQLVHENPMSSITMESVSDIVDNSLFDVTDDGYILIGKGDIDYFKKRIAQDGKHIDPKILKGLIDFLGENSGKKLADLMGYKAFNKDGLGRFDGNNRDNYPAEDIEIGKMLLPHEDGFSLTLSSSSTEKLSTKIKFKFFGINGAANKEYERIISQKIPLSNTSSLLTVHIVSKIVLFKKENGNYFYWRMIKSMGEVINTFKIQNEYLLADDGYKEVSALPGKVETISTIGYTGSRELSTTIDKNTYFKIGCDIKEELYVIGLLGLSGELQFIESFSLDYIIPPNGEYIFTQNDRFFENIWATKT